MPKQENGLEALVELAELTLEQIVQSGVDLPDLSDETIERRIEEHIVEVIAMNKGDEVVIRPMSDLEQKALKVHERLGSAIGDLGAQAKKHGYSRFSDMENGAYLESLHLFHMWFTTALYKAFEYDLGVGRGFCFSVDAEGNRCFATAPHRDQDDRPPFEDIGKAMMGMALFAGRTVGTS